MRKTKLFCIGMSILMATSILVGCSSGQRTRESAGGELKNNIAIKNKYVINTKGGKAGLLDFDKKQVIKNKYDILTYISPLDLFFAKKDGKWGVIDIDEKEILPFKFSDLIMSNTKDKIYASDFKTTTIYDANGKKEKIYDYDLVWNSGKKTAMIINNLKIKESVLGVYIESADYGLMDESGKEIIKPEFSRMYFVSDYDKEKKRNEYIAIYAEKDGKAGVFNLKGDIIIPFEFESGKSVENNDWTKIYSINYSGYTQSYFVTKDGKKGIYDKNGKQLLEIKYDEIKGDHNGYIAKLNDQYSVFDLKGNEVFSDDSLYIYELSDNGFIAVENKNNDNAYYVNSKGNKIEMEGLKGKDILYLTGFDKNGKATIVYDTEDEVETAIINEKGEIVVGPFKRNDKTMIEVYAAGSINESPNQYSLSSTWKDPLLESTDFIVEVSETDEDDIFQTIKSSLYNKEGKKLADIEGDISHSLFSDKFYEINMDKNGETLYGLMDRSGKVVAEPSYTYVSNYYDDYIKAEKGEKMFLLDKKSGKVILEY